MVNFVAVSKATKDYRLIKLSDMNINQILESGTNVQLVINAIDLKEAFLAWAKDVEKVEKKKETHLTPTEVCNKLHVDKSTLWRWNRDGYLKKIKIGGKPFYKLSDIEKLMEG